MHLSSETLPSDKKQGVGTGVGDRSKQRKYSLSVGCGRVIPAFCWLIESYTLLADEAGGRASSNSVKCS